MNQTATCGPLTLRAILPAYPLENRSIQTMLTFADFMLWTFLPKFLFNVQTIKICSTMVSCFSTQCAVICCNFIPSLFLTITCVWNRKKSIWVIYRFTCICRSTSRSVLTSLDWLGTRQVCRNCVKVYTDMYQICRYSQADQRAHAHVALAVRCCSTT